MADFLLFDRKMNWRDIVASWLVDKKATLEGNLGTMELVQLFVERNIVPERLMDNDALHTVLLTQIMWETLKGIAVPRAPQGSTFTYYMNAKECHELGHG
jgi:hypothetical protein